ncbi:hypothetical protein Tco_0831622 [Tanacetum coccineum]
MKLHIIFSPFVFELSSFEDKEVVSLEALILGHLVSFSVKDSFSIKEKEEWWQPCVRKSASSRNGSSFTPWICDSITSERKPDDEDTSLEVPLKRSQASEKGILEQFVEIPLFPFRRLVVPRSERKS